MEPENLVEYWRKRSRQALESQGLVLPPPPPPSLLASPSSSLLRRLPSWRPPQKRVVMNVRRRIERIGLDLICNTCQHHIPKSQRLDILCHFYSPHPHDPPESELTRCYVRCPNCSDIIELGRNLGDPNNFVVFAGATQRFPAVDIVLDSDPNLQNEAYPDALLDSPDDLRRRVVAFMEGELQLSRTDSDLRGIQGRNETMMGSFQGGFFSEIIQPCFAIPDKPDLRGDSEPYVHLEIFFDAGEGYMTELDEGYSMDSE